MKRKNSSFMFSSRWWVENNKAWFVAGEYNILIQIDMDTGECKWLSSLPNHTARNASCIKCDNDIFCMPHIGDDSIWVYNMDNLQFQQIRVGNGNNSEKKLRINQFWRYDDKIFAVSEGLKKIVEINIRESKVENYYSIDDMSNIDIVNSINVGTSIYIVPNSTNKIYQFDMATKKTISCNLPDIEERLYAIGFDGENFWLSGYSKKIYVWNKESNTVETINHFPEQFGIYNFKNDGKELLDCKSIVYDTPVFIEIVALEKYIWFIPFQTNKIIYVNKDTHKINTFEIEEENETEYSLLANDIRVKYSVQYVRGKRYIGLFSYKNNSILEIDTFEGNVERKIYLYDNDFLKNMLQLYDRYSGSFYEQRGIDNMLFEEKLMDRNIETEQKKCENVGLKIYKETIC